MNLSPASKRQILITSIDRFALQTERSTGGGETQHGHAADGASLGSHRIVQPDETRFLPPRFLPYPKKNRSFRSCSDEPDCHALRNCSVQCIPEPLGIDCNPEWHGHENRLPVGRSLLFRSTDSTGTIQQNTPNRHSPGQSFYNPVHHPTFDEENGRVIYFEGTYTNSFTSSRRLRDTTTIS